MSLGAVAASRIELNKIGTPYLKKLMQTVEETCFLGVLSGDEIVYIAKENCERTITTNASIGSRKPVYCTGLGKAFLAFLPEKESSQIIDRIELKKHTHLSRTKRQAGRCTNIYCCHHEYTGGHPGLSFRSYRTHRYISDHCFCCNGLYSKEFLGYIRFSTAI